VHWIINESSYTKNPIGEKWKKLDLVADSFLIPHNYFRVINEIIEELDLYVVDIIPTILGTIESTLSFDNKDLWSITIDIWKSQTSYAIYENGHPIHYNTIPLWGESVSKDISIWLQVDVTEAENTKINYGHIIHSGNKTNQKESVNSQFLGNVITARYEEILLYIEKDLVTINKDWRLPGGVILSWGASKIEWLEELAKDVFKVSANKASDNNNISKELGTNLQFMNVLWLYSWSKKYSIQQNKNRWLRINTEIFKKVKKLFGNIF
jgi:cell division protein FtsA